MPADLLCWISDVGNNAGNGADNGADNARTNHAHARTNHAHAHDHAHEPRSEDSVLCNGKTYSIYHMDHLCTTGFSGRYNCSPYDDELYIAPPNTPLHCLCGINPHAYDIANATITPQQGSYTLGAGIPNHYLRLLYPSGITPKVDFSLYSGSSSGSSNALCACGVGSSRGPFSGELVVTAIPMDKPWSPKFLLSLMDRSGLRKELASSYRHMRLHGGYTRELIVAEPLVVDYVALGQAMVGGGRASVAVVTFAHNAWVGGDAAETAGHIYAIAKDASAGLHINLEIDLKGVSSSGSPITDVLRSAADANLFRHAHSLTLITHTVSSDGLAGLYGLDLAEVAHAIAELRTGTPHLEIRLCVRLVPGFTDQNGEFAALVEFVEGGGVPYVRFVNDMGNPYEVYAMMADHQQRQTLGDDMSDDELDNLAQRSSTLGVRNMLQMLRKKCKGVHLGSYNIPSTLFEGRTYPYLKKTKFKKPRP